MWIFFDKIMRKSDLHSNESVFVCAQGALLFFRMTIKTLTSVVIKITGIFHVQRI